MIEPLTVRPWSYFEPLHYFPEMKDSPPLLCGSPFNPTLPLALLKQQNIISNALYRLIFSNTEEHDVRSIYRTMHRIWSLMDLGFSASHRYPGWLNTELWKNVIIRKTCREKCRTVRKPLERWDWSPPIANFLLYIFILNLPSSGLNLVKLLLLLGIYFTTSFFYLENFFWFPACMYLLPILLSCHCIYIFFLHRPFPFWCLLHSTGKNRINFTFCRVWQFSLYSFASHLRSKLFWRPFHIFIFCRCPAYF